jgi:hypothetical protein
MTLTKKKLERLGKNKARTAIRLVSRGLSVKRVAFLLYSDHSEEGQKRVRALISKFADKRLRNRLRLLKLRSKLALLASQPQPQPQPQPKKPYSKLAGGEKLPYRLVVSV